MSKLEIYTFGSAASHFSNPLVALPSGSATSSSPFSTVKLLFNTPTEPEHVIQYIEHYANSDDLVPRWGVLHSVSHILQNRYAGSVFVRIGASGHLFNQHYLGPMFPKFKQKEAGVSTQRPGECFLDTVIRIDEELCMKRENFAFAEMGIMRRESGVEFGDGNVFKGGAIKGTKLTGDVVAFKRTDTGRLMAEEAKGKTVRELSRFWRYRGGKSPEPMYPQ